ncbi:tyrosine-sulfated glycopeptide receptor 1 [Ziziphus jujuba]|uniref:Tyrosine-sulfated glycopeptide receptor 1 n=1 Tax=Ziziphus jujuba TaxID=326968 RepID=A0A6P4AYZ3_ZIZJJ|nr:tyrosine-sulfated glycopeptide receptor 1 [Ziziphus jujuba]
MTSFMPTFSSMAVGVPMKDDKKKNSSLSSGVGVNPTCQFIFRLVLVNFLLLIFLPCFARSACNQVDHDSLLSFSSSFVQLNWSSSPGDCCSWLGVNCDGGDRVTHLSLPSFGLSGIISPSIMNLTFLTYINLSHNTLSGSLPSGFFDSLNRLQVLDLSYNRIHGQLPSSQNNSFIQTVDLSSNLFHGKFPSSLFQPAMVSGVLTSFNASNNSFTGAIPIYVFCSNSSNSASLTLLDFSFNEFSGQIPPGLGGCSKLQIFRAGFNNLSGPIPDDIYDIATLEDLYLPLNHLSGPISNGIVRLTNLRTLDLYSNHLNGRIPIEIGKLSNLVQLQLHINMLTGPLPTSLMECTNLSTLNLRVNSLNGDLSDLNFSTLQSLTTLDLGENLFTGELPRSLFSCKSLTAVRLAGNKLRGQISPDILELQSLSFLSISNNSLTNFTGAIKILKDFKNLTTLVLSKGFQSEAIPDDDGLLDPDGFRNLQVLALGGCQFTGQVPSWLAKLKQLKVLDLSVNLFTGSIPGWFANLTDLFYIDLSSNRLSGGFPKELCELPALTSGKANDHVDRSYLELPVFVMPNNATNQQYNQLSNLPPAIYLHNNSLSGNIPVEIGQLKSLHVLDLSLNNFSGNIPDQISNLTNLEKLDLSNNHLTGEIPVSLKGLSFLSSFSVANNDLQGAIPVGGQFDTFPNSSFDGNPGLCGPAAVRHSCPQPQSVTRRRSNKKVLIGLVFGICFGTGIIVIILAMWILSKRRIIPRGDTDKIDSDRISINSNIAVAPEVEKDTSLVVVFPNNTNEIKDLTISDILKATDNFNQSNIVGCGGFGLVYKATLANGTKLAVKKLSGDMGLMEREFKAEVEALSTAQHENLVSLQGYCVHDGFRLLIYSYMENGSLDYWLHEKVDGASQLDWPIRIKILQGASCGLAYMHQICEPHIVHRDIKSSNILLDEKFEAHVADFGLSRLILPYQTHVTTELVGTLGYIPPEYGQAWVATLRGDMYSFGVVMLELLTGKRPVEVFKPKMSRELVGWVQQMRREGKQEEVFHPLLRGKGFEEEMLQVLDVACMCVNPNPFKRPTIKEVVDWLKNVRTPHQHQDND